MNGAADSAAPGKRTLTEALPVPEAPVQRRAVESTNPGAVGDVHAAAAHGTSGGGTALPHGHTIQQLFGRHDVSNVQAHVGGKAAEGAAAMGAEAFATGDRVAFARQPDLHTAAHEAAHVVQQRAGVQLKGGVGEVGDKYERHADTVADRVVCGESAEALLSQMAPAPAGSPAGSIQLKEVAVAQQGQIERALPAGVDLKTARASITIPGKRKLAGDWKADVLTRYPTELTVEVSHTGVRAWLSPAIFVDATWPLQNCMIYGANVTFGSAPTAEVEDGHGLGSGMLSIKDNVAQKITDMLAKGIADTPVAQAGYDPTHDTDLSATMNKVLKGFSSLFAEAGHDPKAKPPVATKELDHVSVGATISLKAGGQFMQNGTGLDIAPGSDLTLNVQGAGNLEDLSNAQNPQAAADAAKITGIGLSATGLRVMSGGKPVAQLNSLDLARGGAIKIGNMQLLGKAQDAKVIESGLSLLIGLLAARGNDRSAGEFIQNGQNPKIVDGMVRSTIEKEFTKTVHDMVLQYRGVVPGIDLAKVLGIG